MNNFFCTKKIILHLIYLSLLINLPQKIWAQVVVADSLALVSFYEDTNGDNWTNNTGWLTQSVENWYGITLTADKKNVQQIALQNNKLSGDLPNMSYLQFLTHLYLQDNQLTGELINYTTLPALKIYHLGNNQLEGELVDYQFMITLEELYLYNNNFIGNIPDFSTLPNLNILALQDNALVNQIPNFSNLANLEELLLNDNFLSEQLPNFSNLPQLRLCIINNNKLSGSVPNFSQLTNLQTLQLNNNQLSGTIPDFSNLSNLKELYIGENDLTGAIPNFSQLTQLQHLHLHENELDSTLPNFGQLPDLQELKLNNNELIGTIPALNNCPSLQKVWLSFNRFSGTIPNFANFNQLRELYIENNQLTFAGLEQNIGQNWDAFNYSPQALIPIYNDADILKLWVSAGGTLSRNTYQWYRNGEFYKEKKGDSILTLLDQGEYYCQVSNSLCTNSLVEEQNLILKSSAVQAPDCQVNINNIEVSTCEPTTNTYTVTLAVDWQYIWGSTVTIELDFANDTRSQTFAITNSGIGNALLTFTNLLADSEENVNIKVYISNNNKEDDCIAVETAAYDAPALCCASGCSVQILSVEPKNCNPTDNSYEVDVEVQWENAWYKSLIVKWFGVDGEERLDTIPVDAIEEGKTTFTLQNFVTNNETDLAVVAAIDVDDEGCAFSCSSTSLYDAPDICGFTYVWPGDANNNGVANVHDLLAIGLGYGRTDLLRPNATVEWEGQPCRDWQSTFPTSPDYLLHLNHKYADCDGNDTINQLDMDAISLNYDLTHIDEPIVATSPEGTIPLYWDIPDTIFYTNNSRRLGIHLGQNGLIAEDVYGIAFKTKMTVADDLQGNVSIPFNNMSVDYDNSWLGNEFNLLLLDTCFKEQSRWDIGMTHYGNTSRDGQAEIVAFTDWRVNIEDIFLVYNYFPIKLRFEEVQVIDRQGNLIPVQAMDKTVYIRFAQGGGGVCVTDSPIYPNPAKDALYLECPFLLSGEYNVTVFDVLGRLIHETNPTFLNGKLGIDISNLSEGIYFFQFYTNRDKATIIRKVVVTR